MPTRARTHLTCRYAHLADVTVWCTAGAAGTACVPRAGHCPCSQRCKQAGGSGPAGTQPGAQGKPCCLHVLTSLPWAATALSSVRAVQIVVMNTATGAQLAAIYPQDTVTKGGIATALSFRWVLPTLASELAPFRG